MTIGITAYIEFSTDSFESAENCRAATPGGVFLWHNKWMLNLLGIARQASSAAHPIGFRGPPRCLSKQLVRENHLIIGDDAPLKLIDKKASRRFSLQDESDWLSSGLLIHPIENHDVYQITVTSSQRLILNPGCELPSWAAAGELRLLVSSGMREFETGKNTERQHTHQYNLSVFHWINELSKVYGDANVRLVYWFDSIPKTTLARSSQPE